MQVRVAAGKDFSEKLDAKDQPRRFVWGNPCSALVNEHVQLDAIGRFTSRHNHIQGVGPFCITCNS